MLYMTADLKHKTCLTSCSIRQIDFTAHHLTSTACRTQEHVNARCSHSPRQVCCLQGITIDRREHRVFCRKFENGRPQKTGCHVAALSHCIFHCLTDQSASRLSTVLSGHGCPLFSNDIRQEQWLHRPQVLNPRLQLASMLMGCGVLLNPTSVASCPLTEWPSRRRNGARPQ